MNNKPVNDPVSKKNLPAEQLWLSGNEAIALGAVDAQVKVATGYPGTPSTEIIENLLFQPSVYAEWSTNEKVAVEVAIGASFAGVRSLASMKHVGLNVAADPFFTASYTGCRGGLVIITADDPHMHSSQNEQDNRNYAFAAKLPLLEPADPMEAYTFIKLAFQLSEEFDTPVLFRITTRISHVKGLVSRSGQTPATIAPALVKMPDKFVMLPAIARNRRQVMASRHERLQVFAQSFAENRQELADPTIGFITSSVAYHYVKEAFPDASVLKLAMTYPLPKELVQDFASRIDKLYVVEELDPFLELQVKSLGISCHGKDTFPATGELSPRIIRESICGPGERPIAPPVLAPERPPNMCPGCPHRGIFYNLSRLEIFVSGDIGCYTLGFQPPLSAIDSVVCMGASLGIAHGIHKALGSQVEQEVVAVIGDSTFLHSGITGLIDIVYNKSNVTVVILDNRVTAMTGLQPNPASATTASGEHTKSVDFTKLCQAIGVEHVYSVNPHDITAGFELLRRELARPAPSVIISQAPCALLPEIRRAAHQPYKIEQSLCTTCQQCMGLNCPAIEAAHPQDDCTSPVLLQINPLLCNGCGQCTQLCTVGAIILESRADS